MTANLSEAAAGADDSMGDRPVGDTAEPCPYHWIEVQLLDEEDQPVVGQRYEITLPDGSVRSGQTDADGLGRVDGIYPPGTCQIRFTELDREAWEPI